ncbi:MAG TPA: AsmA family protein, partial [Thiotrichales bacterium]|nr:AsmA family protein [Thiotrichales bacterium]
MVIRRTLRLSWYLGALLVVLLALAMLAGRMLFPLLEDYPATIERLVREQTGQTLTIGEMDFGWSAYGPEMRFHDVALHVEGRSQPIITIGELGIGLDLPDTLLAGQVVTRRIRLQDASLALVRTADGIVHLEGAPHVRSNFLTLLLDQPRLQASGITLRFRDERLLPEGIRITDLAFDLRHRGDRRQLWFELRPE